MRVLLILLALAGCASPEIDYTERMYASQRVTGWRDANGVLHLQGVGGEIGHAVVTGK